MTAVSTSRDEIRLLVTGAFSARRRKICAIAISYHCVPDQPRFGQRLHLGLRGRCQHLDGELRDTS